MTTVFERRPQRPAHTRCCETAYDYCEDLYARNLVLPAPPDDSDTEAEKAETYKDIKRIKGNRQCCWWCVLLLLILLLVLLLVLLVPLAQHRDGEKVP